MSDETVPMGCSSFARTTVDVFGYTRTEEVLGMESDLLILACWHSIHLTGSLMCVICHSMSRKRSLVQLHDNFRFDFQRHVVTDVVSYAQNESDSADHALHR